MIPLLSKHRLIKSRYICLDFFFFGWGYYKISYCYCCYNLRCHYYWPVPKVQKLIIKNRRTKRYGRWGLSLIFFVDVYVARPQGLECGHIFNVPLLTIDSVHEVGRGPAPLPHGSHVTACVCHVPLFTP